MADAPRKSWLPKVLSEIAQVAGIDAALTIAELRGGTEIYVPPEAPDSHWLSEAVGIEAANAICRHFTQDVGARRLEIPLGPAGTAAQVRRQVDKLIADGRSEREIALATGYTGRGVRMRRAKARAGIPENDLFAPIPERLPGRTRSRK